MSVWLNRRVFVTGATGLLGSWLVEALVERGAEVVALVRDRVPPSRFEREGAARRVEAIVPGGLDDRDLLERALGEYEVETIFHCAAQTIVGIANRNPISTFESNIRGTWNLLEAARRSPRVREVVVASSDKAYGDQPKLPYDESTPLAGTHPYDVSKSCADLIARSYFVTYKLAVSVTRCGNLFGGGDLNWNRLIPGTIRSALLGERPIIRSDGTYLRDYFYVRDAAGAYLALAEAMRARPEIHGEAFNFSNERPLSVLEATRLTLAACGRADLEPDVRGEATNEIVHQYLSSKKAREMLGWRPAFTLEQGLAETVAWYRRALADPREREGRAS
jgi:CDP-glucose 4,6-dehydratase